MKNQILYVLVLVMTAVFTLSGLPHILIFAYLHFIGDYVLTTPKMQKQKTEGHIEGIVIHSTVHALLLCVFIWSISDSWVLALTLGIAELWWHTAQDHIKSWINRNLWGDPCTREYWIIFGLDQFLHIYAKHLWLLLMLYWQ